MLLMFLWQIEKLWPELGFGAGFDSLSSQTYVHSDQHQIYPYETYIVGMEWER